jgi:hypothetical protein
MAMPAPKLAADAGVAASNANSKGSASTSRRARMPALAGVCLTLDGDLAGEFVGLVITPFREEAASEAGGGLDSDE